MNPQLEVSDDDIREEMQRFWQIIGRKKVCMVAETGKGSGKGPKKEQRALIAAEIANVTKAMAVIISSPLAKAAVNLFYTFAPPPYPIKMFTELEEAKIWIRKYNNASEELPKKKAVSVFM